MGTAGRWTVSTRGLAAVVALALSLSGCWAQVGFGAERQRHNPFERAITADNVAGLTERWAVEFAGGVSEPMVSGGRLYVGHATNAPRAYDAVALEAGTGEVAWRRNLMPADDGMVLTNPVAFSGPDLWTSYLSPQGTRLVRLDPDDGATLTSEDAFVYGPVVTSGNVFAYTTVSPSIFERQLVVRDRGTSATLWTREFVVEDQLDVAMANGRVYVTNGPDLMAFDAAGCGAATCDPLWQVPLTEGQPLGNLAVGPGDQVITTTPFHTVEDRHGNRVPVASNVIARDGATGAPLWATRVEAVASGIAVTDEAVYVPTRRVPEDPPYPAHGTHGLTAFSLADGARLWAAATDVTPGAPLSAAGVVYIGVGGALHAYAAGGCGATTCPALATFPGAGHPRSIGDGQLYTTSSASGDGTTTLRAYGPG